MFCFGKPYFQYFSSFLTNGPLAGTLDGEHLAGSSRHGAAKRAPKPVRFSALFRFPRPFRTGKIFSFINPTASGMSAYPPTGTVEPAAPALLRPLYGACFIAPLRCALTPEYKYSYCERRFARIRSGYHNTGRIQSCPAYRPRRCRQPRRSRRRCARPGNRYRASCHRE